MYNKNMRAIKFIILTGVAVYVIMLLYFILGQSGFIYFPSGNIVATPANAGLEYDDLRIETSDGVDISAWFVPAADRRGTLLFCHGNAGNISHRIDSIKVFNSLGLDVLIFDYRGYGTSSGSPSEEGTYLDALASYRYLTETLGIPDSEIVLFGRSLGASVAARLASRNPAAGLILDSAFTSITDLGAELYPLIPIRHISRFSYNTTEYLKDVKAPVMVIHSSDDEIIPFSHGERIYSSISGKKKFLRLRGSHNDGFVRSSPAYIKAVSGFLDTTL